MDNESDDAADMTAMYGTHSPWQVPEFPRVTPGPDHVVLCEDWNGLWGVVPDPKGDKWDQYHVRMPYSEGNSYGTKKRWNVIKKALRAPINNSSDLAEAILKYNDSFQNVWRFLALHRLFNQVLDQNESEDFFKNTLPKMVGLALNLNEIVKAPIPLLKQQMNASISMSQLQVASLLANAFFCTFPRRNSTGPGSEYANYPRINFTQLYERIDLENVMEKLKCIVHYFKRVTADMPCGVVTYTRRAADKSDYPRWESSAARVGAVPVLADEELRIEDAAGLIQVDFANKYLGGGVLGRGCVQEEIRFLICPELIASMLFTEKLAPNEAVIIIGCERYSKYTGYGRGFQFAGNYEDRTPFDGSGRRRCAVVAIDAVMYYDTSQQYQKAMVNRELNKAWIGFSYNSDLSSNTLSYPGVATGNWGCGAFRGSPQLKSLLQLMACAQARRPMAYLSFGDTTVKNEVVAVYNLLKHHDVTVGQLYMIIEKYCKRKPNIGLHEFIDQQLNKPVNAPRSRSFSPQNLSSCSDFDSSEDDDMPATEPWYFDALDLYGNRMKTYSGAVKRKPYEGTSIKVHKPRNNAPRGRGRLPNASLNRSNGYPAAAASTSNINQGYPAAEVTDKTNDPQKNGQAFRSKASTNSNQEDATASSGASSSYGNTRNTTAAGTISSSYQHCTSNKTVIYTGHNAASTTTRLSQARSFPIPATTTPSQSLSYTNSASFAQRTIRPLGKSLEVPGDTSKWNSGLEKPNEPITMGPKRQPVQSPDLLQNPSTSRNTGSEHEPSLETIEKNSPSSSSPHSRHHQTVISLQQIMLWPVVFPDMGACAIVFALLIAVVKYAGPSFINRYLNFGPNPEAAPEGLNDNDTTLSLHSPSSSATDHHNSKADKDLYSNENKEVSCSSSPQKPARKRKPRGNSQGIQTLTNPKTAVQEHTVEEKKIDQKWHTEFGYPTRGHTSVRDNNLKEQRVRENQERDWRYENENRENEDEIKGRTSKQELKHDMEERKLESPEDFQNNIKSEQSDINKKEVDSVKSGVSVDIKTIKQRCNLTQSDCDSCKRKKVNEIHYSSRKIKKVNHDWDDGIKISKGDYECVLDNSVLNASVPTVNIPDINEPDSSLPDINVPDSSVPNNSVPDDNVLDNSVPDKTVPDKTVPDKIVPDKTVPDKTVLCDTVSDNTVPGDSVLDGSEPNDSVSSQFGDEEDEKCTDNSITTVAHSLVTLKFHAQRSDECITLNMVKSAVDSAISKLQEKYTDDNITIKSNYTNSDDTIIEVEKEECSDGRKTLKVDDECAVDSMIVKLDNECRVDNITLKVNDVRSHDCGAPKVHKKCSEDRSESGVTSKSNELCGVDSVTSKVDDECDGGGITPEFFFVEDGVDTEACGDDRKTTKVDEKCNNGRRNFPKLNEVCSDDYASKNVNKKNCDDDDSTTPKTNEKYSSVSRNSRLDKCLDESVTLEVENECADSGIISKVVKNCCHDEVVEKDDDDNMTPKPDKKCAYEVNKVCVKEIITLKADDECDAENDIIPKVVNAFDWCYIEEFVEDGVNSLTPKVDDECDVGGITPEKEFVEDGVNPEACGYDQKTTKENEKCNNNRRKTSKLNEVCSDDCASKNVDKKICDDDYGTTSKTNEKYSSVSRNPRLDKCVDESVTQEVENECADSGTISKVDKNCCHDEVVEKDDDDNMTPKPDKKCAYEVNKVCVKKIITLKADDECDAENDIIPKVVNAFDWCYIEEFVEDGVNSLTPKVDDECDVGGITPEKEFVEDGVNPEACGYDQKTTKENEKCNNNRRKTSKLNEVCSDDCASKNVDKKICDDDYGTTSKTNEKYSSVSRNPRLDKCVDESVTQEVENECADSGTISKVDKNCCHDEVVEKDDDDNMTPKPDKKCAYEVNKVCVKKIITLKADDECDAENDIIPKVVNAFDWCYIEEFVEDGVNSLTPKVDDECDVGGITPEKEFVEDGVNPEACGYDQKTTKENEKCNNNRRKTSKLNEVCSDDFASKNVDKKICDDDYGTTSKTNEKYSSVSRNPRLDKCVDESVTQEVENECADSGIISKVNKNCDHDEVVEKDDDHNMTL